MGFRAQLESTAYQWPMEQSRFIRLLDRSRCPAHMLQRYSIKLHAQAAAFPQLLARLIKITEQPEARLHLLENLMEEEGVSLRPQVGLGINPNARHPLWSARFAMATGVTEQQLAKAEQAWEENAVGELIEDARWLEAIAYLMLGIEANVPRTFSAMLPGLRRAGFTERELTMFSAHIIADTEHGDAAFTIVEKFADTPHRQELALKAVARGAEEWWNRHNGTPATNRHQRQLASA
jgi:pyrroloquinoline quinone (PQQ) biosynthesis protein C